MNFTNEVATPKGKTGDRRLRNIGRIPTREELAYLQCPFEVFPETKDTVPAQFSENARHLTAPQENAPWTGYYATLNGAKIAVTNVYGVWFEIRRRKNSWEAHRVARVELNLFGDALPGIDIPKLIESGEPITCPPSRQDQGKEDTPLPAAKQPGKDASFGPAAILSSQAVRDNPRRPKGTGDDPFTFADLGPVDKKDDDLGLEGSPPDRYDGDRERTTNFLTRFNLFMMMNHGATITLDPIRRCAYFLSLMDGPEVAGWTERNYEWLDKVKQDPTILPPGTPAWRVLEADFRHAFADHAGRKRALDDLMELKMEDGKVDDYTSTFERLAHKAGVDLDDPTCLMTFARGLPRKWADACITHESPESFQQWVSAAQRQQLKWLKMQALRADHWTSQPPQTPRKSQQRTEGFSWRRPDQNIQGKTSTNAPRPRLPPRDNNMKDTPAIVRKATSEKEKQEYRRQGRCFACGTRGHLARDCPTKKAKTRAV